MFSRLEPLQNTLFRYCASVQLQNNVFKSIIRYIKDLFLTVHANNIPLTFIRRGSCSIAVFCLDREGFFLESKVWRKIWCGWVDGLTMNPCSILPHRKLSAWRHRPQEGLPVWEYQGVSLTAAVVPSCWFLKNLAFYMLIIRTQNIVILEVTHLNMINKARQV